jgi:UTP--glucose-1-phosphate uridylyltransferase
MTVRKAVLPAAGLGTRFLPVTKSVCKEMLPILDRPCIEYVVVEAIDAGLTDIVLVTSRGKVAMEDYFDRHPALEAVLEAAGLAAAPAVGEEPFAVLLGDDIITSQKPAIGQLLEAHASTGGAVVALKEVPREETRRYGICAGEMVRPDLMRVQAMVEKPRPEEAPSTLSIVGRYVLPGEIFRILAETAPGAGGEIQLTDAIAVLAARGEVHGLVFEGLRFDTGNPLGLLEATLHFALNRPDTAAATRELLARYR